MTTTPSVYHALLRPSILQILRATGYHSTRPAVLDSITDLAARYMLLLCENTAGNAVHNHGDAGDCTVTDVRLALQDAGALLPDRVQTEQDGLGEEDMRGVDEFIRWFAGQRMKEMMEIGSADGEADATDYLNALKKKHGKTGDESKYLGTMLGRDNELSEVQVEGGPETSISEWVANRISQPKNHDDDDDGDDMQSNAPDSPAPSSGLSSVGHRLDDVDDASDIILSGIGGGGGGGGGDGDGGHIGRAESGEGEDKMDTT